jgi:hypothetical protein
MFRHNHHLCQGICLAWVQVCVFRCRRTALPAHLFWPVSCSFKCSYKWKSLGVRSGLSEGWSETSQLKLNTRFVSMTAGWPWYCAPIQRSFQWEPGNVKHEGVTVERVLKKDKQRTVEDTVMCLGISLSQQFEENAVVGCLPECACCTTTYSEGNSYVGRSDIFSWVIAQRLSPVLASRRRSTWPSLQIGWGVEGGGDDWLLQRQTDLHCEEFTT